MSHDIQKTVQSLLTTFVEEGKERGIQAAAYLNGELIVDAWAGVTDFRTGAPVDGDSLFPVFSTTKGVFSTVIHILAERGKIDYDKPIAHYWPEFAVNGKEKITVRHALSHTSGLQFMPEGVTVEQIADWDGMCRLVAQMTPVSPAGAKQIYHPVTFGWLVGEVARRADGRSVPQLLEEEICRPLGITRMFCGIPAELETQTAFLELVPNPPVTPAPPPNDVAPTMMPLHEWINRPIVRRAPQPGCSGIMNARSVARHYAALLPGGIDGIELLPPSRIKIATEVQLPSEGLSPEETSRKGLGYQLGYGVAEMGKSITAFGHNGHGGSTGFGDPRHRLAVGVVRNRFADHPGVVAVTNAIYRAFGLN